MNFQEIMNKSAILTLIFNNWVHAKRAADPDILIAMKNDILSGDLQPFDYMVSYLFYQLHPWLLRNIMLTFIVAILMDTFTKVHPDSLAGLLWNAEDQPMLRGCRMLRISRCSGAAEC
jgi:hypothetical protein